MGELVKKSLESAEVIYVVCDLEMRQGEPKLLLKKAEWFSAAFEEQSQRVTEVLLTLPLERTKPEWVSVLKGLLLENRGKVPVRMRLVHPEFQAEARLPDAFRVQWTPEVNDALRKLFGEEIGSTLMEGEPAGAASGGGASKAGRKEIPSWSRNEKGVH
jgi:hypothetical protein